MFTKHMEASDTLKHHVVALHEVRQFHEMAPGRPEGSLGTLRKSATCTRHYGGCLSREEDISGLQPVVCSLAALALTTCCVWCRNLLGRNMQYWKHALTVRWPAHSMQHMKLAGATKLEPVTLTSYLISSGSWQSAQTLYDLSCRCGHHQMPSVQPDNTPITKGSSTLVLDCTQAGGGKHTSSHEMHCLQWKAPSSILSLCVFIHTVLTHWQSE